MECIAHDAMLSNLEPTIYLQEIELFPEPLLPFLSAPFPPSAANMHLARLPWCLARCNAET